MDINQAKLKVESSKEIQLQSLKKEKSKHRSTIIIKDRISLLNTAKEYDIDYNVEEINGTKVTLKIKRYE